MTDKNNNDKLPTLWFMLSNAMPPVGVFLYFKYRNQFPDKARRALMGALAGLPAAIVMGYIFNNYLLK